MGKRNEKSYVVKLKIDCEYIDNDLEEMESEDEAIEEAKDYFIDFWLHEHKEIIVVVEVKETEKN